MLHIKAGKPAVLSIVFNCIVDVHSLTMIYTKLIVLLCCTWYTFASQHSEHSYTIPVEGYEAKLQDLGQHVDIPETPVKLVKITKTIAVKIPVPYPVKVIEKVPYPVHVAKPYPVPVPQIIKVPHVVKPGHGHDSDESSEHGGQANSYNVEEAHEPSDEGQSYGPQAHIQSFGGNPGHQFSDEYSGPTGSSYNAPAHGYHLNSGNGDNSFQHNQFGQLSDFLPHNQGVVHSDEGSSHY